MIERKNSTQRILPISSACLVYQISSFFPWSVYPSAVNKLFQHDLLGAVLDAVHRSYPFKLIGSFERFGHTLPVSHLPGEQVYPINTGTVDLRQMLIQPFGEKQIAEDDGAMLFEVISAQAAILANRVILFREGEVGDIIIAGFYISEFHIQAPLQSQIFSFTVQRNRCLVP